MACLTKDGSLRGQKSGTEFVSKPPLKILIIPAKDLVQVTAQVCYFERFAIRRALLYLVVTHAKYL